MATAEEAPGRSASGTGSGRAHEEAPALEARRLLRAARAATLATQRDGQPFASLVTPASLPDGTLLLLLSGLSEHTRHLEADNRCALMATGSMPPGEANPQTAPRVTVTGVASPCPDPEARARWLAVHPYAGFYAGLGDFRIWRMEPLGALFVGGFARAHRLRAEALRPEPAAVAAVAAAEAGIIGHCNADHADALVRIAVAQGAGEGEWRMVAVDVDGFDLCAGERVVRVAFAAPVTDSRGVRAELVRMVRVNDASGSEG